MDFGSAVEAIRELKKLVDSYPPGHDGRWNDMCILLIKVYCQLIYCILSCCTVKNHECRRYTISMFSSCLHPMITHKLMASGSNPVFPIIPEPRYWFRWLSTSAGPKQISLCVSQLQVIYPYNVGLVSQILLLWLLDSCDHVTDVDELFLGIADWTIILLRLPGFWQLQIFDIFSEHDRTCVMYRIWPTILHSLSKRLPLRFLCLFPNCVS